MTKFLVTLSCFARVVNVYRNFVTMDTVHTRISLIVPVSALIWTLLAVPRKGGKRWVQRCGSSPATQRQWTQARARPRAAVTVKYITAAGAVSVIHFPSSRQILIMSRVLALIFVCYLIQTVNKSRTLHRMNLMEEVLKSLKPFCFRSLPRRLRMTHQPIFLTKPGNSSTSTRASYFP